MKSADQILLFGEEKPGTKLWELKRKESMAVGEKGKLNPKRERERVKT